MQRFLWISLGGAVGTGARYLLTLWAARALGPGFPYATLAVNLIGSFLLALLTVVGTESAAMSPTVRLALTTGVMGGLTTCSTFSYETLQAVQSGAYWIGVLNVLATVVGCLLACVLGQVCGRWWAGA